MKAWHSWALALGSFAAGFFFAALFQVDPFPKELKVGWDSEHTGLMVQLYGKEARVTIIPRDHQPHLLRVEGHNFYIQESIPKMATVFDMKLRVAAVYDSKHAVRDQHGDLWTYDHTPENAGDPTPQRMEKGMVLVGDLYWGDEGSESPEYGSERHILFVGQQVGTHTYHGQRMLSRMGNPAK